MGSVVCCFVFLVVLIAKRLVASTLHAVQFLEHLVMGFLKVCDVFLKRQMGYSYGRLVGCVVSGFSVVSVLSLSVSSVGSLARTSLFLSAKDTHFAYL